MPKSVMAICIVFIFLTKTPSLAKTLELIDYYCYESGNYTKNSTYETNLNWALSTLSTTNNGQGYFKNIIGQNDDRVNVTFLCRGDITLDLCYSYLNHSVYEVLDLCPNQKGALMYYDQCMLNYFNDYMIPNYPAAGYGINPPPSAKNFKVALKSLMENLINQASAGGFLRKFSTGNASVSGGLSIYGLVQCAPDISQSDCIYCLQNEMTDLFYKYNESIYGNDEALLFQPLCFIMYETYPFFNVSTFDGSLVTTTPQGKGSKKVIKITIVAISVAVFVIILFALAGVFFRMKKLRSSDDNNIELTTLDIGDIESLQYDLKVLKTATNGFSNDNLLGRGGFGSVYKGTLEDGQEIAVKRQHKISKKGDIDFKNEMLLLSKLRHRNLVRLLGFSIDGKQRLLIFEFLPNGSLDKFLSDPSKCASLNWISRYNILLGIAKGLLYLHVDSPVNIIHRDIKSANILLDSDMNPKIADLGTSREFKPGEPEENTKQVIGTHGYMSPEYFLGGNLSEKIDVYSFGVIILEMVAGRKTRHSSNPESSKTPYEIAWEKWQDGTVADIIDSALGTASCPLDDILRVIRIGLLCCQDRPRDRPKMSEVVQYLTSSTVPLGDPVIPAFMRNGNPSETALDVSTRSTEPLTSGGILTRSEIIPRS